jgi:hypothetical protein
LHFKVFLAMLIQMASNEKASNSDSPPTTVSEHNTQVKSILSVTATVEIDEKRLLRKMDLRLLPMLSLLYLLCFLDRGNIGNASIEGMVEDLDLTGNRYSICCQFLSVSISKPECALIIIVTVFFFTYAACEVPSNLLLKRLRPSIWLPTIVVSWGIVMVRGACSFEKNLFSDTYRL